MDPGGIVDLGHDPNPAKQEPLGQESDDITLELIPDEQTMAPPQRYSGRSQSSLKQPESPI
jgi:hypothetical protein